MPLTDLGFNREHAHWHARMSFFRFLSRDSAVQLNSVLLRSVRCSTSYAGFYRIYIVGTEHPARNAAISLTSVGHEGNTHWHVNVSIHCSSFRDLCVGCLIIHGPCRWFCTRDSSGINDAVVRRTSPSHESGGYISGLSLTTVTISCSTSNCRWKINPSKPHNRVEPKRVDRKRGISKG